MLFTSIGENWLKIVVTGGMGFIGGHLALKLLGEGHEVHVFDNLSTACFKPNDPQFAALNGFKFFHVDIATKNANNLRQLKLSLERASVCYHFAGPVGVGHINEDPFGAVRNLNALNQNMLKILSETQTKTFFASTSEVYGNNLHGKETDDLVIGSPERLRWGYACEKLSMEFLLKAYKIPHLTLRFFNVTGKGQVGNFGMVLPRFLDQALKQEPISIYGDGTQLRSFCDIDDALMMIAELAKLDEFNGEAYNIGNDKNVVTIGELAMEVKRLTRSTSALTHIPFEEVYSKEIGEIFKRGPNIEKISKHYSPQVSLEECINKAIRWKKNEW